MGNKVFKVIVAGGRDLTDYNFVRGFLDYYFHKKIEEGYTIEIVSGGAKGADSQGAHYSKVVLDRKPTEFPAPWGDIDGKSQYEIGYNYKGNSYWKLAGSFRNGQMAEYADALIAFWDGKSTGTKNMIKQAKQYDLKTRIVKYKKIN